MNWLTVRLLRLALPNAASPHSLKICISTLYHDMKESSLFTGVVWTDLALIFSSTIT